MHILCVCDRRTDKLFVMASTPFSANANLLAHWVPCTMYPPQKKNPRTSRNDTQHRSSPFRLEAMMQLFLKVSAIFPASRINHEGPSKTFKTHGRNIEFCLHVTQPDYELYQWCNAKSSKTYIFRLIVKPPSFHFHQRLMNRLCISSNAASSWIWLCPVQQGGLG